MNALISVYHKDGIDQIARILHQAGWTIYSTGGTFKHLIDLGIPAREVSSLTQYPEILDGRVKTLHPKVFGPILARHTPEHLTQLQRIESEPFSLVVVNFYPFETAMTSERAADHEFMTEQIDIGGPSMVRAAAKNHRHVTVITDPRDYGQIAELINETDEEKLLASRKELAFKAFSYTSYYDHLISSYFQNLLGLQMPLFCSFSGRKEMDLRYGENPQQKASLYHSSPLSPLKNMNVLWGKALSFNNMLDLSTVYEITNSFATDDAFAVIVKHQNPCGAALGDTLQEAFIKALSGDPVSAFGGIVGFNRTVDGPSASELSKSFFEVIVAPDFTAEALTLLKKKKNLRLISWPAAAPASHEFRQIPGGFLLQQCDLEQDKTEKWVSPTDSVLDEAQSQTVLFGLKLIKFVKSNAIILVHDRCLTGVGAGQMSRVDSVKMAIEKAAYRARQSILISDAFFPFADSIDLAHQAGIDTVIEPGGSVRDDEVIKRARELGVGLFLTGVRHFRH